MNLLDLDPQGLEHHFAARGEKPFRARQVSRWLHQRLAGDVASMTDLAKSLRASLAAHDSIEAPAVIRDTTASDGTRKWLFDVGDGNAVEAVFIPEDAVRLVAQPASMVADRSNAETAGLLIA